MNKIYIKGDRISIHDPTIELLPFIKTINPDHRVSSVRPSGKYIPAFEKTREIKVSGIDHENIVGKSLDELREAHAVLMSRNRSETAHCSSCLTLLDLKKEIAFRSIRACGICAWECGVNRYNEKGRCGLDYRAYHHAPFVHIAEEAVINPAIVINFSGCSWDCVYCIAAEDRNSDDLMPLNINSLWKTVAELRRPDIPVNVLEFAGGNPTESVHWILEMLSAAPHDFCLPVVFNVHTYASEAVLNVLNGVVDIYLVDMRYGNDECARRLSRIEAYWFHAVKNIATMVSQGARVIVRILVLPGHFDCCHRRVLEWLAQYRKSIWVSVLGQYVPEHLAGEYKEINHRPTGKEVEAVEALCRQHGLRIVDGDPAGFWQ